MARFSVFHLLLAFGVAGVGWTWAESAHADQAATTINLTVSVKAPVMQDTLSASLDYRVEGPGVDTVQQAINRKMQDVWALASGVSGVKLTLAGYAVWFDDGELAMHNRLRAGASEKLKPQPKWVGQQSIRMKGKDFAALKQLVGDLQQMGLATNHFGFHVSEERREQTQDALMPLATSKLIDKTRLMASALGVRLTRLEEVSLGGRPNQYNRARYALAAPRGGSTDHAPVGEPVEVEITLVLAATAAVEAVRFD